MTEIHWRDVVDPEALADWMDRQGLPAGPLEAGRLLAGGTQNLLFYFEKGDRRFVLRRPPLNPRANNDETMRREARVLAALAQTDVPHPRLIAACADASVMGNAFYLMEPVDGFNATVALPPAHRQSAELRRRMGFALVEGAAALSRLDHIALGLADFGKPENYLARQVQRWNSQLASYADCQGWPGVGGLPGIEEISSYLQATLPQAFQPGIMHGDYHIANVMYCPDTAELAAIVDWELATIGDPLIDLGWILATWRDDDGIDIGMLSVDPWDGFPNANELIEHYSRNSDRDLSSIDWYVVLACFKLAILLEGSYARACSGKAPVTMGNKLHFAATKLLERALLHIE